jgi:hypothetical protein
MPERFRSAAFQIRAKGKRDCVESGLDALRFYGDTYSVNSNGTYSDAAAPALRGLGGHGLNGVLGKYRTEDTDSSRSRSVYRLLSVTGALIEIEHR